MTTAAYQVTGHDLRALRARGEQEVKSLDGESAPKWSRRHSTSAGDYHIAGCPCGSRRLVPRA